DLRVAGVSRVHVARVVRQYPYRSGRVEVRPQAPHSEDDPLIELERRALVDAWARLATRLRETGAEIPALTADRPFQQLVNAVCMALETDPLERLTLLEMDSMVERSRRAREMVEASLRVAVPRRSGSGETN